MVVTKDNGQTRGIMNEVSVLRLPVKEDVNEVIHGLEGAALKHSDSRLPFQIFPDPCEEEEVPVKMRGRLPSIVVEPTDIIDVESGELRWPPESARREREKGEHDGEKAEEEDKDQPPVIPSWWTRGNRITDKIKEATEDPEPEQK
ncbi:protein LBH-like isoform X2 [Hyla sarda]|uniref:protein LBH-like isoform X2 n=1 Tax=Hyla sarda TaxID=327740 RepID=UPI0024C3D15E|nr:protein LBH-like isoform X2 [Hyla sarda]